MSLADTARVTDSGAMFFGHLCLKYYQAFDALPHRVVHEKEHDR